MNKEFLQKRIMENVQRALGKALNEDFQFDDTEVADKLLEIVRKDKQIQKVVASANANDWLNVLRGMVKLIKSNNIPENPAKIANIVQLATAFLQRGIDSKLQEKMKEFTYEDLEYTSNFMVKEIAKFAKPEKGGESKTPANNINDNKQEKSNESCENKNEGCDDKNGNDQKENKSVSESRRFRRNGGFSKFLNENHLNIRPGRK